MLSLGLIYYSMVSETRLVHFQRHARKPNYVNRFVDNRVCCWWLTNRDYIHKLLVLLACTFDGRLRALAMPLLALEQPNSCC